MLVCAVLALGNLEKGRPASPREPHLGLPHGPDTWHARYRGRDGVQHYRALRDVQSDDNEGALQAAQGWFAQLGGAAVIVFKDPIADLKLEYATRDDFDAWRDRLTVGRQPRTVNH